MVITQEILKYIVRSILIVIVTILLLACSSHHRQNMQIKINKNEDNNNRSLFQTSQDKLKKIVLQNTNIQSRILNQYENWKGVRYLFGGTTKNGIDCSAFVQVTFQDQFGLKLPRSTMEQKIVGRPVLRKNLRPGDLILFNAGFASRHIGIYLGNNTFVHASTSRGVVISSLNNTYWKNRYREARRVLY